MNLWAGQAKQLADDGVNTGMHYNAARALAFGEKCLHYCLWSKDIFIHYLASIVCIAVEWVEALFCHAFWLLFGYEKSNKNIKMLFINSYNDILDSIMQSLIIKHLLPAR